VVQDKKNILGLIKNNEKRIQNFGVRRLGLFGSFVRGEQNKESDVDLLVEFDKGKKSFDNFIHLSFFWEDLLHHRVELVTPESLSPHLKPYITQEVEYLAFGS